MVRPSAVVFDMDGLLLDSERVALDSFLAACDSAGWHNPDLDTYLGCIGSTWEATPGILRDGYGPHFPVEAVLAAWNQHYEARVSRGPIPVKAGAAELLAELQTRGVPAGLATSTHRPLAERKLADAGLLEYFSATVCGGEANRGKPHPDPYLRAAALLGVLPSDCWACEDSDNGTRAAVSAGFTVYQVPDLVESECHDLGHEVVASLDEVLARLRSLPM